MVPGPPCTRHRHRVLRHMGRRRRRSPSASASASQHIHTRRWPWSVAPQIIAQGSSSQMPSVRIGLTRTTTLAESQSPGRDAVSATDAALVKDVAVTVAVPSAADLAWSVAHATDRALQHMGRRRRRFRRRRHRRRVKPVAVTVPSRDVTASALVRFLTDRSGSVSAILAFVRQASSSPTHGSTSSQMPSASASASQGPPHSPSASSWLPSQSQSPAGMPSPPQMPHSSRTFPSRSRSLPSGMSATSTHRRSRRLRRTWSVAHATGVKLVQHTHRRRRRCRRRIGVASASQGPPHSPRASSWLPSSQSQS